MTPEKSIVRLDPDRCKGCLLCTDVCPNDLLHPQNGTNRAGFYPVQMVDGDYCFNCLRCVDVCPERAFVLPRQKAINWQGYAYWFGRKIGERLFKKNHGHPG